MPGAHETAALASLRDQLAVGLGGRVRDAELPTLALVAPNWTYTTGGDEPAATVRASRFDLTRAMMSRRTAEQLRSWTDGDIGLYLELFSGLGPLPEAPLPE